jgi:pseudouridine kinase
MQGTLKPPPGFMCSAQAALNAQGAGVVDMNLPQAWLQALLDHSHTHHLPLAMVAVSVSKMAHLPRRLDGLSLLVLNADELAATGDERATPHPSHQAARDALWQALHARGLKHLLVTLGPAGAAFSSGECLNVLPAVPLCTTQVVDATGAGDAFSAAAIHALLCLGQPLASACQAGLQAAARVLQTRRSALSTLP